MKHLRANDFHKATLQPTLHPEAVRRDPVLDQVEIPLNAMERLTVKVIESYGRPVLSLERQKTDRTGMEWRVVGAVFRVSLNHGLAISKAIQIVSERLR